MMKYLIWSNEQSRWWKPYRLGYTSIIEEAGLYDIDEATEICENANRYGLENRLHGTNATLNEIMVPSPFTK